MRRSSRRELSDLVTVKVSWGVKEERKGMKGEFRWKEMQSFRLGRDSIKLKSS